MKVVFYISLCSPASEGDPNPPQIGRELGPTLASLMSSGFALALPLRPWRGVCTHQYFCEFGSF